MNNLPPGCTSPEVEQEEIHLCVTCGGRVRADEDQCARCQVREDLADDGED